MTTTSAPTLNTVERCLQEDYILQAKLGVDTVVVGTILNPIILDTFREAFGRRGQAQGVWSATKRINEALEAEISEIVYEQNAYLAPARLRHLIELRVRYEIEKGFQEGRYNGLLA